MVGRGAAAAAPVVVSRGAVRVDGEVEGGGGTVMTITGLTCLPACEARLNCPPIMGMDPDFNRGPTCRTRTLQILFQYKCSVGFEILSIPCRETNWSRYEQQHAWSVGLRRPYS